MPTSSMAWAVARSRDRSSMTEFVVVVVTICLGISFLLFVMTIVGSYFDRNRRSKEDLDYDEETMVRVYKALISSGIILPEKAFDVISEMQKNGIYFREQKAAVEERRKNDR